MKTNDKDKADNRFLEKYIDWVEQKVTGFVESIEYDDYDVVDEEDLSDDELIDEYDDIDKFCF